MTLAMAWARSAGASARTGLSAERSGLAHSQAPAVGAPAAHHEPSVWARDLPAIRVGRGPRRRADTHR